MWEHELPAGGLLRFWPQWLAAAEAARFAAALRDEVPWRQEAIRIAGREILQPRLTAWYGDVDAAYTYSGLALTPRAWTPVLAELRQRVTAETGCAFNSVLLNLYRDGRDSMGFHADQERELGRDPAIASVSLGASRRFILKPAKKGSAERPFELSLSDGSLLLMAGSLQHHYKHGVPKEPRVGAPRINLTFRKIL